MIHSKYDQPSSFTKMQQIYWEAKRVLKNSAGSKDDDCLISNDLELDSRIRLLHAADNSFNYLIMVLKNYNMALKNLKVSEEKLSTILQEYGALDFTKAGKVMAICGKALSRISRRRVSMQCMVVKLLSDVQTYQQNATADAIKTVGRMEQARKSYRSGLMWLKNESQNLDPEANQRMKKFRKVQSHIKRLQIRFNNSKLETLQKIDLYLLSRCNLFSQTLASYRNEFCKISAAAVAKSDYAMRSISTGCHYKFETLKELNVYFNESDDVDLHKYSTKSSRKCSGKKASKYTVVEQKDHRRENYQKTDSPLKFVPESPSLQVCEPNSFKSLQDHSDDTLINFNEECDQYCQVLFDNNLDKKSGKYSQDIESIVLNFKCQDSSNFKMKDLDDVKGESERGINIISSNEKSIISETENLEFWTLMQNLENQEPNFPSVVSNQNVTDTVDNKAILLEFDPYALEKSLHANESEESC